MPIIDAISAFEDNYIWLIQDEKRRFATIVDPGDEDPVIDHLESHNIQPIAILITHHHGDHTGGVTELVNRYQIPVYGPAGERIPALTQPLSEGDNVILEQIDTTLNVMDVPGHTRGHIAYYGHDALFCGDTLFTGGCGRLFEGTFEQMHRALSRFAALPEETRVYCAHEYTQANLKFALVAEPENSELQQRVAETDRLRSDDLATVPSTIGLEKRTNPFLRSDVDTVIAAAEQHAGHSLQSGAEVFATVRQWKDELD